MSYLKKVVLSIIVVSLILTNGMSFVFAKTSNSGNCFDDSFVNSLRVNMLGLEKKIIKIFIERKDWQKDRQFKKYVLELGITVSELVGLCPAESVVTHNIFETPENKTFKLEYIPSRIFVTEFKGLLDLPILTQQEFSINTEREGEENYE
jgi:hypothetical protein